MNDAEVRVLQEELASHVHPSGLQAVSTLMVEFHRLRERNSWLESTLNHNGICDQCGCRVEPRNLRCMNPECGSYWEIVSSDD